MEVSPHGSADAQGGPRFLLTIPAFRESERLPAFLEALASLVDVAFPRGRVVVCDDGSGSAEQARLEERISPVVARHDCLLPTLFLADNRGKGGAILAGWDAYPGYDFYGFIDADGAISPGEFERITAMLEGSDRRTAFFASRVQMLGRSVERSVWRHMSGRIFARMVAWCIEPDTHDSQCGFKFIPTAALKEIRPWLKGRQFAFDVELLAFLLATGYRVIEVAIDWRDIPGNKLRFLRDSVRMARAVMAIREEMVRCRDSRHERSGNG